VSSEEKYWKYTIKEISSKKETNKPSVDTNHIKLLPKLFPTDEDMFQIQVGVLMKKRSSFREITCAFHDAILKPSNGLKKLNINVI